MPAICTNVASVCVGGNHATVTIDGRTFRTDSLEPLSDAERDQLFRLAIRHKGVALATLLNRVVHGDEATNVKLYTFFGPGAAISKAPAVGTAYVNVAPGLNGERIVADFTGCTEFRFMLNVNIVGTGQLGARCVRDGDDAVLIEDTNLGAAGERELDSDWQPLPATFVGQGLTLLRVQCKSTVAADDPVFRRCQMGLR
jgi:hypothetical protein